MTGTTAAGWPYVTPDDHPKEYPAQSQALANKLEASAAGLAGSAVRGSDSAALPAGSTNVVGSVTVAGATGRKVMVVGELRFQHSAASNITVTLKSGTTVLRTLLLAQQPASVGPDALASLTGVGTADSDTFTFEVTCTTGTITIRVQSAIHVITT